MNTFLLIWLALVFLFLVRVQITAGIMKSQLRLVHERTSAKILRNEITSLEQVDEAYEFLKKPTFFEVTITLWWWTRKQVYGD